MSDEPCDLTKRFIARPTNSKKFHIFEPDCRALCKKWMMLFPDAMDCVPWTGAETIGKDDCAACFRKATSIIKAEAQDP